MYPELVEHLETKEMIRSGPFDAAPCGNAGMEDLDFERMAQFIRTARQVRQFPLPEGTPPPQLLEHLNLLNGGRITNAAVLLFGKKPQRFLITSEIKCAHFHGTEVAKPIPFYQVYKGVERMGTGTLDMIRRCVAKGLPEPDFAVTDGFVTTIWRAASEEPYGFGDGRGILSCGRNGACDTR